MEVVAADVDVDSDCDDSPLVAAKSATFGVGVGLVILNPKDGWTGEKALPVKTREERRRNFILYCIVSKGKSSRCLRMQSKRAEQQEINQSINQSIIDAMESIIDPSEVLSRQASKLKAEPLDPRRTIARRCHLG